jgi:hypothetical protein
LAEPMRIKHSAGLEVRLDRSPGDPCLLEGDVLNDATILRTSPHFVPWKRSLPSSRSSAPSIGCSRVISCGSGVQGRGSVFPQVSTGRSSAGRAPVLQLERLERCADQQERSLRASDTDEVMRCFPRRRARPDHHGRRSAGLDREATGEGEHPERW